MTQQEKLVKIAEACGWEYFADGNNPHCFLLDKNLKKRPKHKWFNKNEGSCRAYAPQLNSLDAMREAVCQQDEEFQKRYALVLYNKCIDEGWFDYIDSVSGEIISADKADSESAIFCHEYKLTVQHRQDAFVETVEALEQRKEK